MRRALRGAMATAGLALALMAALGIAGPERLPAPLRDLLRGEPPRAEVAGPARVIDGDTLAIGTVRLRLHGVDAPEMAQSCERDGAAYACGAAARAALARIAGGAALRCAVMDTDRYGRKVARCRRPDGVDIGAALVAEGWAVAFRRYSTAYLREEAAARAARRGVWAGRFDDPAAYRRAAESR